MGKLIPNPYISLPIVFLSNFVLDAIPHWDTGTGWHHRPKIITFVISAIDVFLGFGLAWMIFRSELNPVYLFTLAFTATLADWAEAPYIFLDWDFFPFNWFYKLQSKLHARNGSIWGVISQVVVVGFFLIISR